MEPAPTSVLRSSSSSSLIGGKTVAQWLSEIKASNLKPTEAKPPQSFRNRVVQARIYRDRDQFIASIRDDDVCRLAALYHNGDTCTFFKPPSRGSYNICYFVQFQSSCIERDGDKWVVRVPLAPCLAFGGRSKLESEVATMQLVADRTTIPIPRIHAYALGDGPELFPSFLILEYVEGLKLTYADFKKLSDEQRTRLYTSLADIYIQLRRLEFPSIGCVTREPDGFEVRKRTVTIDLNMQELEGLAPSEIQDAYYSASGTLTSANDYIAMLLQIADNAFSKGCGTVSEEEGEDHLYHLHLFRQYAEHWVDRSLDRGPFALIHGDLELFNLLLGDDMNIVSVLDWEWSRVVPRQLFKPPLWLSNTTIEDMSYGYRYRDYLESLDKFLVVLRVQERERYGSELLADEWDKGKQKSGFMVANALENWTAMDWFASRYINLRVYGGKEDLPERIKTFIQDDPARKALIERKVLEWTSYTAQLQQLDAFVSHSKDRITAAPDGKQKSASTVQSFLTRLWLWKIPIPLPTQALPFAWGSILVIIAGTSYLFGRRMVRLLFSH
ncbi:hypothetical protein G7Y89_g11853 [Cudoniella acicularis]|uniref:Aminoglycoside phosphotransferase domain-containing protein n=1 Tax=Cudoniella acicularis TaxID=354080 RepID=A0A8H4VXH8_9HELO|nr:hypothetical protein G7Y89_g11853 [Cudoniella acicularis]